MIGCCLSNAGEERKRMKEERKRMKEEQKRVKEEEKRMREEQKRVNDEIELQLIQYKRSDWGVIKAVAIETKNSGERTFLKMVTAWNTLNETLEGSTERLKWKKFIFQVVFQKIQVLCKALESSDVSFVHQDSKKHAKLVLDVKCETVSSLDRDYVKAIRYLWRDPGIREVYYRTIKVQEEQQYLQFRPSSYFLDDLGRISDPGYIPDERDILTVRLVLKNGVTGELLLRSISLRIIDISQQWMTKRQKWIHCLEDTSVVFSVGLKSEYKNRFEESIALFKEILAYPQFQSSPVLLCFNQTNAFNEEMLRTDLAHYFPDYDGPSNDSNAAKNFILKMFADSDSRTDGIMNSYFYTEDIYQNCNLFESVIRNQVVQSTLIKYKIV